LSHPKGEGKAGRLEAAKSGNLTGSSPLDRGNFQVDPIGHELPLRSRIIALRGKSLKGR